MSIALQYFVVVLLLSMVSQGLCHCSFGEIEIGTVRTGREVAGQPEWKVTVINTCSCFQKQVTLSCGGFAPVKPVAPRLLLPHGNTCLVNKGEVLAAHATVEFTYVGEPYFFKPVGSTVDSNCKDVIN